MTHTTTTLTTTTLTTLTTTTTAAAATTNTKCRVKSAKPGENVTVKVVCSDSDVMRGFVLCSSVQPCHAATLFVAQIALVELTEQV